MKIEYVYALAISALAVSAIPTTIVVSEVFEHSRRWLGARSGWASKLVRCPYCTSHWIAAAVVTAVCVLGNLLSFTGHVVVDVIVASFAVVALAGIVTVLICRSLALRGRCMSGRHDRAGWPATGGPCWVLNHPRCGGA